jgi:hypothetical protein
MGEPKEKPTVEQVMKLVDQLTLDERGQLLERLQHDNLKRAIQTGNDQADRGEVLDGDVVLAELRARAEERLRKSQQ